MTQGRRDRLRHQLDSSADRRTVRGRQAAGTCTARCGSCGWGQGVDATGEFAPEALARTESALADYVAMMAEHSVHRGADGGDLGGARCRQSRRVLRDDRAAAWARWSRGALAEVITGTEEAELSFRGAVGELDPAAGPFVVVDLGGGSTEVVRGDTAVRASFSADIGCVRLTERCLHSDPPTADEVARRSGGGP